jgi:hypothetical protein
MLRGGIASDAGRVGNGIVFDAGPASDATADAFADGSPEDAFVDTYLSEGDATAYFGALSLDNNLCSPNPLPTNPTTGMSPCRLLFLGVTGGCDQPGLQPASAADIAACNNLVDREGQQAPSGALCSVNQIVSPSGASCADDTMPGWCYVLGSCEPDAGLTCKQDVCASVGLTGEHIAYAFPILDCD